MLFGMFIADLDLMLMKLNMQSDDAKFKAVKSGKQISLLGSVNLKEKIQKILTQTEKRAQILNFIFSAVHTLERTPR